MYNFDGSPVLLVDTVLIFILHVLVQDLMERGGLDGVEKLLEPELLVGEGWSWCRCGNRSWAAWHLVRGGRGEGDGEECQQQEAEEEAFEDSHLLRFASVFVVGLR